MFGNKKTGGYLLKFGWIPIERHILVRGNSSPDDPALKAYWAQRTAAKAKDLAPRKQRVARKQKGLCPGCGQSLFNEEDLHLHHKVWKSKGGEDTLSNYELVHLFCHQQIHV